MEAAQRQPSKYSFVSLGSALFITQHISSAFSMDFVWDQLDSSLDHRSSISEKRHRFPVPMYPSPALGQEHTENRTEPCQKNGSRLIPTLYNL